MNLKKPLPKFESVREETDFWRKHSILEFVGKKEVVDFLRHRNNRSATISLRVEPAVLEETKKIAGARGVKYQALLREWIYEGIRSAASAGRMHKSDIEALTELVMGISKDLEELKSGVASP